MRATIPLGRWFGIPVGLHYSWFIIAWLITVSLASQFAILNDAWSRQTVWLLALVTALLFFVGLLLHELAHSTVARAEGIRVRGITLFALGGVSQIEEDAATPGREFWMAIVGPLSSIVIGLLCLAGARGSGWTGPMPPTGLAAVLGWLAYINIALGVFNLIPGFPLDGGRVLRSIVWAVTRSKERATQIAARIGQGVAFVLIGFGLLALLFRGDFGGLWIAFIGWFLLEASGASYAQVQLSTTLQGVRVGEVMARQCATVEAGTTVQRFVNDQLLRVVAHCFAVSRGDRIVGLIGSDDVKRIDRAQWDRTTVADAMRPIDTLHPVTPDVPAGDALALMARENVNQLPVISDGHLQGVVTRSYLVQLLHTRRELRA
ncbi:MAG: site-2 protease family protein [Acidobacteria bacterium]|nr:site-2 protease family protein [Acidobacteriota bacterium]